MTTLWLLPSCSTDVDVVELTNPTPRRDKPVTRVAGAPVARLGVAPQRSPHHL